MSSVTAPKKPAAKTTKKAAAPAPSRKPLEEMKVVYIGSESW